MPVRFMVDTDHPEAIESHAELFATYSDLVTDLSAFRKRYPHSEIILIDRGIGDPTGEASVFDIEAGSLTIEQAVQRYDDAHRRGVKYLTVYHDRAIAAEVDQAFSIRNPYHWYATLDATAFITGHKPLGSPAAIQCLTSRDLGFHADGSLVFEDGWHPTRTNLNAATLAKMVSSTLVACTTVTDNLHEMARAIGG